MSTSNISGRPEKSSQRSGRAPIHHRTRDGGDEYRYAPHDLEPQNVAQLEEVIRAVRATSNANITVGIIGQLAEPFENYEPEDTTLYHPHRIRRANFLRLLTSGVSLQEALSQATNHEWSEVYTVYIEEEVRPT